MFFLEEIRLEAGIPVRRFLGRLGVPASTWYYWRAGAVHGRHVRRWPAPVVDRIEEAAAQQAQQVVSMGPPQDPRHAPGRRGGGVGGQRQTGPEAPWPAPSRPLPDRAKAAGQGPQGHVPGPAHQAQPGCGRPTSPSSRPPPGGRGGSARWGTTGPSSAWPHRSSRWRPPIPWRDQCVGSPPVRQNRGSVVLPPKSGTPIAAAEGMMDGTVGIVPCPSR